MHIASNRRIQRRQGRSKKAMSTETPISEADEKRRELQLLLLREGLTQDDARKTATRLPADQLDELLKSLRKDAMRYPERQIVLPGTVDLQDVKTQREEAISDAEDAEYFERQDRLQAAMAQSFSVSDLPTAVLLALLSVLERNGIDRLNAIADIIEKVEYLQKLAERERECRNQA
jgi:hypothetical protein